MARFPRLVKHLLIGFGVIVILAASLPLLFEDAIGERALAAVRQQLRSELHVGGTSLSLLSDFPYASVSLTDVQLNGYPSGKLLEAERLSGRLSYYDLLFADGWVINTITVANAELHINRDVDKHGNWEIFTPTQSDQPASINFAISRILLDNVHLVYDDLATSTLAVFAIADGELAGAFGSEAYVLNGKLAGRSERLDIASLRYIEDMALTADIELSIDPQANTYTFGPSTVSLDGMPIEVRGDIGFVDGATAYTLDLATEAGKLGVLLRALPKDWITPFMRSLESKGAFHLEGSVVGLHDAHQAPAINFAGRLREGSLLLPSLDRKAENVSFTLDYSNGKGRSMADSRLELSGINAQLDGQPLNGGFTWLNFDDPLYEFDVTGTLPLAWLDELWQEGTLTGKLDIRDLRVKGRQRHLVNAQQARHITTSGEIIAHGAQVNYNGQTIRFGAGDIKLKGADLHIDGGSIAAFGNQLALELTLQNFVPYLLGDNSQTLSFNGEIATPAIDLDQWVGLFASAETSTSSGAATTLNEPLASGFAARLKIKADKVTYKAVKGRRFTGTCSLSNSKLSLHGEGQAMEGHWEIEGDLALQTRPSLAAKLSCSEVNITELFEQTNNVGQQVVAARNLEGQMTTRAYVEAAWNERGDLLTDQLHVWANVGLTDGGLWDFEMLQALSKFVRADELRDVRFTDVENWIEVEESTVYLPAMFIQSTASNFTVAGQHSFVHDIDYSVQVNGAQVVLNKLFGKRQGIDFLPDRRGGWVKTGFKIDGRLEGDDYDVRMAGAEVRRHFRASQQRKNAIRTKLAALFGQERLIDDYDAEGVRIPGRPQRGTQPTVVAEAPQLIERPTRAASPQRQAAVQVDTETYIEGWGEDEDAAEVATERQPTPAIARNRRAPNEAPPARSERVFDGLFKSQAPAEYEPPAEEDEYLEGFDGIEPQH